MALKFKSIVLLAACYLLASCNNSGNSDTANKDTTTLEHTDTTAHENATNNNASTAAPATDLMGAMNGMMDRMHSMKMSGDFDMDWANMNIEHHQGAIDMAQVEISQGKDEKLKAKAQEILTKQKDEQQKLRDMQQNMKPSSMKMGEGELEKAMSGMMDKMKSMQMSGDVDKDFANMMTQHHKHGIDMAKMEVKNGMNDDLKKMAQKSIPDQQKDIADLKQWASGNK